MNECSMNAYSIWQQNIVTKSIAFIFVSRLTLNLDKAFFLHNLGYLPCGLVGKPQLIIKCSFAALLVMQLYQEPCGKKQLVKDVSRILQVIVLLAHLQDDQNLGKGRTFWKEYWHKYRSNGSNTHHILEIRRFSVQCISNSFL